VSVGTVFLPRMIAVRVEDDSEISGYCEQKALLVGESTALSITNGQMEVLTVKKTEVEGVYELLSVTDPLFRVGEDVSRAYEDAMRMSFWAFVAKYPISEVEEQG
jgi:hypothetical protein